MRRLASLVPPPYRHQVRYHGLFASAATRRAELAPGLAGLRPAQNTAGEQPSSPVPFEPSPAFALPESTAAKDNPKPIRTRLPWADLLRHVFKIDVLVCPKCAGPMVVLAYLTDPQVLTKILSHLGLPHQAPPLAPAKREDQLGFFAEKPCAPDDFTDNAHFPRGRDPPSIDAEDSEQIVDTDESFFCGA